MTRQQFLGLMEQRFGQALDTAEYMLMVAIYGWAARCWMDHDYDSPVAVALMHQLQYAQEHNAFDFSDELSIPECCVSAPVIVTRT